MSVRLPSSTRPSGASASTPCPGTATNEPTGGSARPRSLARGARSPRRSDARSPARPPRPGRGRRPSVTSRPTTTTSVTLGCPTVSVPVLSKHHGVDAAEALERGGAPDQHTVLGAAAGADHDGRRRGQPQGARAGDDQHGHGVAERVQERRLRPQQPPADERQRRRCRAPPGRTPPPRDRPDAGSAPREPCASSTSRTIRASVVSLPTRVARKTKLPVRFTRAAEHRSPRTPCRPAGSRR